MHVDPNPKNGFANRLLGRDFSVRFDSWAEIDDVVTFGTPLPFPTLTGIRIAIATTKRGIEPPTIVELSQRQLSGIAGALTEAGVSSQIVDGPDHADRLLATASLISAAIKTPNRN